jgi:rhamnose transport system permease protein
MEKTILTETRRYDLGKDGAYRVFSLLMKWESVLVIILVAICIANSLLSPYFLDPANLLDTTFNFSEKAIIALLMAFVIIAGDIDISVASIVALSSVFMGMAAANGADAATLVGIGLLSGLLMGSINGFLITRFGIPSIAVTLGTMSLFRGIAYVILGDQAYTKFPAGFDFFGQGYIGESPIPFELVLLAVLALAAGLILHRSSFGRRTFAIGCNVQAAKFSGVPVNQVRFTIFALVGLMSGLASVLLTSRILSTRPNIGTGLDFEAITIVILGGVAITGGEGTMIGVILSTFVLGFLKFGMSLVNVPGRVMNILTGTLLIIAILVPKLMKGMRNSVELKEQKKSLAPESVPKT